MSSNDRTVVVGFAFALALGVLTLGVQAATAQQQPAGSSLIQSPSSSDSTSENRGVTDKTSNMNTMNSQGATSGSTSGLAAQTNSPQHTSPNPSGSGTSTSGGVDYNGDRGADAMKRQ